MQTVSPTLAAALKTIHTLKAIPKVTFEWNQNRYAGIKSVDNDPSDEINGADLDNFPIEVIVDGQRPHRGIIKGRTSEPKFLNSIGPWRRPIARPTGDEGFTSEDYSDEPGITRYYTTGPDAVYKYWTSPRPTTTERVDNSFVFPSAYEVRPTVLYKNSARVNKIVVGLENSWAGPTDYDIQVTQNGGTTWITLARDLPSDENGQVVIYRQPGGSWGTEKNLSSVTNINGIRLVVRGMSHSGAHFNLIELSARLEVDMSPYVISYGKSMEISDTNFLTPIGKASSNTASVTLSNVDGLLNNENNQSIYYRLIDRNILITCDLEYDLTQFGGGLERVREFTMYSDQWSGTSDLEMTVECKDSSRFFQEQKVPHILLQNITVGEAVWRICDAIGFTNYSYDRKDTDAASTLEYFWTEEEDTVWDTFQSLAEATQTAVYFDEFDILHVKSRESAYDLAKAPVWNLEADNTPEKLADIVEANVSADYEANKVNINYTTTKVTDDNNGLPEMQILWQPEDSFVLRASRLTWSIGTNSPTMKITPSEVAVWPYEALVNIEGELIRYSGKGYTYYAKNGRLTNAVVKSLEQKNNIDKNLSDPLKAFMNTWNGLLYITERGVYWTSPREHTVDIAGWSGRYAEYLRPITRAYAGLQHHKESSLMRIVSPSGATGNSLTIGLRGRYEDEGMSRYGARIKFPSNAGNASAGIVFNLGPSEAGYYVELAQTSVIDANGGAQRKYAHEVRVYGRYAAGNLANHGKGRQMQIGRWLWYDLDVEYHIDAQQGHNIRVWVNGSLAFTQRITSGRIAPSGRHGLFVRGKGVADFEYHYAFSNNEVARPDESVYMDKVTGGFQSGQWDREFIYGTRNVTRKVGRVTKTYKQRYNQYFFDEFGPIVHEVREMDIPFEKYPALHSRLYLSNDTQIVCPEYTPTPFGAKFMLANTSRINAVGNGEDTSRFGADNAVDQRMMIYGRVIFQEEPQLLTVKNNGGEEENMIKSEDNIRRRGTVEVDIDSKWIQSKSEAEALGRWILKHWSGGNDEVECEIFGNPILQLGDVVTINYPSKNMRRSTHRYFIVGIESSFETGLETTLTLRRAKV